MERRRNARLARSAPGHSSGRVPHRDSAQETSSPHRAVLPVRMSMKVGLARRSVRYLPPASLARIDDDSFRLLMERTRLERYRRRCPCTSEKSAHARSYGTM